MVVVPAGTAGRRGVSATSGIHRGPAAASAATAPIARSWARRRAAEGRSWTAEPVEAVAEEAPEPMVTIPLIGLAGELVGAGTSVSQPPSSEVLSLPELARMPIEDGPAMAPALT